MTFSDEKHGLLATFAAPETLGETAHELRRRGYRALDAFTPFPVEGLAETLGDRGSPLGPLVFAGGALGFAAIFGLEAYSVLVNYPLNIGGRPLFSWPAFIIPAFEGGVLGAALFGFFGMLALNRLPRLYHPVFNTKGFSFARDDRFYLLVASTDPLYDRSTLPGLLRRLGAVRVEEVEP
jgi:hypothetical protein